MIHPSYNRSWTSWSWIRFCMPSFVYFFFLSVTAVEETLADDLEKRKRARADRILVIGLNSWSFWWLTTVDWFLKDKADKVKSLSCNAYQERAIWSSLSLDIQGELFSGTTSLVDLNAPTHDSKKNMLDRKQDFNPVQEGQWYHILATFEFSILSPYSHELEPLYWLQQDLIASN